MKKQEKITTIRKVGDKGKQTTIPNFILRSKNVTGIKWTLTKDGKIIIEVVE